MSHAETNPHFIVIQQREGQRARPPTSSGIKLPSSSGAPVSPDAAPLNRRDQRNQPLGSRGTRHQGDRYKPQRPRGGELQGDGTLQPPRKQSAPRQDQDRQPHDPHYGGAGGGYSTPWLFPHPTDGARPVHDPQRDGRYHSPWIRLPHYQGEDQHHRQPARPQHQGDDQHHPQLARPQHQVEEQHHPQLARPQHQEEDQRHPQLARQPDSTSVTEPQHQEKDHYPLHPRDSSLQPAHQQERPRQSSGLRTPAPQKTRPITWLAAAACAIFWIIIFLAGLIVLIVYLVYRPHSPRFEVPSATLNAAFIDAGSLLNADITVLANFTNPNKKVDVDFTHIILDLYYENTHIATQYIESFSAARAVSTFAYVHLVTSQVRLPSKESVQLQEQSNRNGILLNIKGVFRVRSNLGSFLRYSYHLYAHCTIMVSAPPNGVLRATRCRTKR
ncbi:MADS-box MEF2 type transcription factor MIG1-like [Mercurialis annua]|uniref:MADS-box MEF2 type transcription factor MIG1-like n=1 Tax=Mercurialis annua TaxID=3986 RepID=UPI00215DDD22|nr:MADS-box MEF2 type transcription factor MIG1-like [Mercurialis annua]